MSARVLTMTGLMASDLAERWPLYNGTAAVACLRALLLVFICCIIKKRVNGRISCTLNYRNGVMIIPFHFHIAVFIIYSSSSLQFRRDLKAVLF